MTKASMRDTAMLRINVCVEILRKATKFDEKRYWYDKAIERLDFADSLELITRKEFNEIATEIHSIRYPY